MSLRDRLLALLCEPDYRPANEYELARRLELNKKDRGSLAHEVRLALKSGEFARAANGQRAVLVAASSQDMQLGRGQLTHRDRRMGCHENLQRRWVVLRAERLQQHNDAMRLQSVLQFIDQDDRSLRRCLPLQACDQEPG